MYKLKYLQRSPKWVAGLGNGMQHSNLDYRPMWEWSFHSSQSDLSVTQCSRVSAATLQYYVHISILGPCQDSYTNLTLTTAEIENKSYLVQNIWKWNWGGMYMIYSSYCYTTNFSQRIGDIIQVSCTTKNMNIKKLVKVICTILLHFTVLTQFTTSRGHSTNFKLCKIYKCRGKLCCNVANQG